MAAELFSTSVPHGSEVEVKKGFIQSGKPEQSDGSGGGGEGGEECCGGDSVQANVGGSEQDDKDGWQETQPTLRER